MKKNGPVDTGSAAITSGRFGKLKCKWIIHAVGPMGYGGASTEKKRQMASAVRKVLELADENDVHTLSMPAVASGIFGFPKEECAKIMILTSIQYFTLGEIERVDM